MQALARGLRSPETWGFVLLLLLAALPRLLFIDRLGEGWHYDEAVQGIFAREILTGVNRPVFFQQFTGQEPLYFYLAAAVMWLVGDNDALPVRLTSALVGTASVVLLWAFARETLGRRIAWLAAMVLALSVWGLLSSRSGYRAVTLPMVELLAVWLLAVAWRRGSPAWFAAGGVALGAVAYTYLASRFFPFVLLLFGLWMLLAGRRFIDRRRLIGSGLALGAAGLTVAPLAWFFVTHPGDFFGRASTISLLTPAYAQGDSWALLADSLTRTAGWFSVAGDPLWRFNVADRPVFVGLLVVAFVGGLVGLAWRAVRGDRQRVAGAPAPPQTPYVFLALVLAVMTLPMTLSAEFLPYSLRAIGIQPFIMIVPGLFLDQIWRWIDGADWPARWRLATVSGLLVLVFGLEAAGSWQAYFGRYQQELAAAISTHVDLASTARALRDADTEGFDSVWVSADEYRHPTFAGLAPALYPRLRWFDGRFTVVFPAPAARPVLYAWPWSAQPIEGRDAAMIGRMVAAPGFSQAPAVPRFELREASAEDLVVARRGWLIAGPSDAATVGDLPGLATIGRFSLPRQLIDAAELPVVVVWQPAGPVTAGEPLPFVQLVDGAGVRLAADDRSGYLASEWQGNELAASRYALPLGPLLSGTFSVETGFFDRASQRRYPLVDAAGTAGDRLRLPVRLVRTRLPDGWAGNRSDDVGGFARLIAAGVVPDPKGLEVRLGWSALAAAGRPYTVFVQLLGPDGRVVSQSDGQPAANRNPTDGWVAGEVIPDVHQLRLDATVSPGSRIIVGMYAGDTGQRLPAGGADFVTIASYAD